MLTLPARYWGTDVTIRPFINAAAVASTNALRFECSLAEAAKAIARHLASAKPLAVPRSVSVKKANQKRPDLESTESPVDFARRNGRIRRAIAKELNITGEAQKAITFFIVGDNAWFLGPRPNLSIEKAAVEAARQPGIYLRLALLAELISSAAHGVGKSDVLGGFGPSVYYASTDHEGHRIMQLAEVQFDFQEKHNLLLCNLHTQAYLLNTTGKERRVFPSVVGQGQTADLVQVQRNTYRRVDARRYPMKGIHLAKIGMRRSRIYYLNILTEYAARFFQSAGVAIQPEHFQATHYVEDGFISAHALASLQRPLVLVNTKKEPLTPCVNATIGDPDFDVPLDIHIRTGMKVRFERPDVMVLETPPHAPEADYNYLYLNGIPLPGVSSVLVANDEGFTNLQQANSIYQAYEGLHLGAVVADAYTTTKYHHIVNTRCIRHALQGWDAAPGSFLEIIQEVRDGKSQWLHQYKRCLIELSIKECFCGVKPVPALALPSALHGQSFTLLATRRIALTRTSQKQLVAKVNIRISEEGIHVEQHRKSQWSQAEPDAIDFLCDYPFLQSDGKSIRDNQFWIVDDATGHRLAAWHGAFVPKIILNARYAGIETALSLQETSKTTAPEAKYYSKEKRFNLFPYYISMANEPGDVPSTPGQFIAIEDRGNWLRVFVPPADAINGSGANLSCMRDVLVYDPEGQPLPNRLLSHSLVLLYLHTMTAGLLVEGNNSKMSILEKLARTAIEN